MLRFLIALFVAAIAATAHAQQADLASARTKELKAGIKTFRLELNYNGQQDKPFYRLVLSMPPIGCDRSNPFYRLVQVSEERAGKIIDHLGGDGFLTKAVDLRNKRLPRPTMPGYTLTVGNFYEDLGWDLPMLKRLDRLREVVDGDAAKAMDLLLGRLSGWRKEWEKRRYEGIYAKFRAHVLEDLAAGKEAGLPDSVKKYFAKASERPAIVTISKIIGRDQSKILMHSADPRFLVKFPAIHWAEGDEAVHVHLGNRLRPD